MPPRSNSRTCNHCKNGFVFAGVYNTLCADCKALGHRAPFEGICILCQVEKEMAEANPELVAKDVPQPRKRVKRPLKPAPYTGRLTI